MQRLGNEMAIDVAEGRPIKGLAEHDVSEYKRHGSSSSSSSSSSRPSKPTMEPKGGPKGRLLYSSVNPNRNRPWLLQMIQPQFHAPLGNAYFEETLEVGKDKDGKDKDAGAGEDGHEDGRGGEGKKRGKGTSAGKSAGKKGRPQGLYFEEVARSRFVLGLPGVGYDCYRLWESLLLGSIPVIESGYGLDRTMHKLPVLLLDDFASLTPSLLHQAFAEAQYHFLMGQWDFRRLTRWYWEDLILLKDLEWLTKEHPLTGRSYPVHRLDVCECKGRVCYEFRNYGGVDHSPRHEQRGWGRAQWGKLDGCTERNPPAFGADFTTGSQQDRQLHQ
jgi:hypothetical protein